jgi:hypothetical protein
VSLIPMIRPVSLYLLFALHVHIISFLCSHELFISSLLKGIFGESYGECLEKIKQQYVTATAIGSMVGECEMSVKSVDTLRIIA